MCLGEKRKLTVPSHLAFEEKGIGDVIPSGATLVFDIELTDIVDSPPPKQNLFKQIDTNLDNRVTLEELVAHSLRKIIERMNEAEVKAFLDEEDDGSVEQAAKQQFKEEDVDGDGFISYEEFKGPKIDHESVVPLLKDNYLVLSQRQDEADPHHHEL